MRTRAVAMSASLIMIALVAVLLISQAPARAYQSDASPVASPVDEATPIADEPESGIVTMVLWYQQNSTGEILQLTPIEYESFMATRAEASDETEQGRVVFDESRNEGYPRIRVGEDNYFDAYPVYPEDPNTVQRWLYFDEDPAIRPATMVMQIVGIRGDYEDWFGTATFISRGGEQGGILIIAISPPAE